jgi:radical SAM superfamily enzyme YgiQ (UPF0313 family)
VPEEFDAQIDILDEGIQEPHFEDNDYDVVGITCVASSASRAYELAEYWRSKGAYVVLGGAHPTLMPEEAQQHADTVAIGLAEETWPQLLRDLRRGAVKKRYHAEYTGELSSPRPRRDLFPRLGYLALPTVIAKRLFYKTLKQTYSFRHIYRRMQAAPHSRLLVMMANLGLREALASSWRAEAKQESTLIPTN